MNPHYLYTLLAAHYGELDWWPADSPYEVMVGAILTQNTAWENVEKAIANFNGSLTPQLIEALPIAELIQYIRPAGFFNQKAVYLKELTAWFKRYSYNVATAAQQPLDALRRELLAVKGVGEETADSVLLYALGLPSFVVDAYTKRLLSRLGISVKPTYRDVQHWFTSQLPREVSLYNNIHACIVILCKEYCRAKPKCEGCPMLSNCKNGTADFQKPERICK